MRALLEAEDGQGRTPLQCARQAGDDLAARVLENAEARVALRRADLRADVLRSRAHVDCRCARARPPHSCLAPDSRARPHCSRPPRCRGRFKCGFRAEETRVGVHQRSECPLRPARCPSCQRELPRQQMVQHAERRCQYRRCGFNALVAEGACLPDTQSPSSPFQRAMPKRLSRLHRVAQGQGRGGPRGAAVPTPARAVRARVRRGMRPAGRSTARGEAVCVELRRAALTPTPALPFCLLVQEESCPKREVNCNRCRAVVQARRLKQHMRHECATPVFPCPRGCGFEGSAPALASHTAEVRARWLLKRGTRQPLRAHPPRSPRARRQECPFRRQPCRWCGRAIGLKDGALEFHEQSLCPKRPAACPLGCGAALCVDGVASHASECPLREVPCPQGCGQVMTSGEVAEHIGPLGACRKRAVRCGLGAASIPFPRCPSPPR